MFNFTYFPEIRTERLKLRCFTKSDVEDIFIIRSDYEVTKYNSGPAYTDPSQALNLVERSLAGFLNKSSLYWAITINGCDTVVGQAGFNCWDTDNNSAEIGFDLKRDQWRQGIMTEALAAILSFGFMFMGLNRVGAQVSTYNESSKALLEKLNFQWEGKQREQYFEDGKYHDLELFAVLRGELPPTVSECKSTVASLPFTANTV